MNYGGLFWGKALRSGMHHLARTCQVLYDYEMLENARQVHELRQREKPVITAQALHVGVELQWIYFEDRYHEWVHTSCMHMPYDALLPTHLFNSEFPMHGVMAGVNAVFRTLRYCHYNLCRAECLMFLENPFKNIVYNCWYPCFTVEDLPFTPLPQTFVRQHSHLPLARILELSVQA